MRKKFSARAAALGMSGVLLTSALTGCTFGFASDPDDPNAVKEEVPIDMTTDTFQYDTSLSGTSIVIMNTKAEIQTALEKIAKVFEEKAGVHIEIMPVTDGDSPYTKVVSLYNSGNPPTLSILDTTDVIALAEEKAADLSNEAWTGEAEEYLTKINGKVYSFPLCIEGRGIIYNKSVIEDTLGTEFDPSDIKTQDDFAALLQSLRDNGMKNPISMAKEDWSLGAHQLQYIYETYNGTSDGAAEVINELKDGTLYLPDYTRMNEFLNTFDLLKEYNVAKGDPLGADYDEMAIDLADGKTAFWFNGNWAWPNLEEGKVDIGQDRDVNMETGHPVRAPKETTDAYGIDDPIDEDFGERKVKMPEADFIGEPFPVRPHNLDTNHHVNNAQFISLAGECLPKNFTVRRMRAEYKQQAHLGDVLHPLRAETENGCFISLNDEKGQPYVVVEFQ